MKVRKLSSFGFTHELILLSFVFVFLIGGVSYAAAHQKQLPLIGATCTITNVPKNILNTQEIFPTVTIKNTGQKAFTDSVQVNDILISPNGTEASTSSSNAIAVPVKGTDSFVSDMVYAKTNYSVKVVATSTDPAFNCSVTTNRAGSN